MTDDIETKLPYLCKTPHLHTEVVQWCEQNYGEFGVRWYRYGTDIAQSIVAGVPFYDYYRFASNEDAMLFILRWS